MPVSFTRTNCTFNWIVHYTDVFKQQDYGWIRQGIDRPVCVSGSTGSKEIIATIYVDDLLIVASAKELIGWLHQQLCEKFIEATFKDGDELSYLGRSWQWFSLAPRWTWNTYSSVNDLTNPISSKNLAIMLYHNLADWTHPYSVRSSAICSDGGNWTHGEDVFNQQDYGATLSPSSYWKLDLMAYLEI